MVLQKLNILKFFIGDACVQGIEVLSEKSVALKTEGMKQIGQMYYIIVVIVQIKHCCP